MWTVNCFTLPLFFSQSKPYPTFLHYLEMHLISCTRQEKLLYKNPNILNLIIDFVPQG